MAQPVVPVPEVTCENFLFHRESSSVALNEWKTESQSNALLMNW